MWKKIENERGIPYYVRENGKECQWDHPKFADIKQQLDECNSIKYGNYRVAAKFRVLQHAFYMDGVALTVIAGVFERHHLGVNESSLALESVDLEAVLTDIYFAANKQSHTNTDIDFATELILNFLFNVFDKDRTGKIQVSETKLLLSLLSNCQLTDLYKFIFSLCSDHNNCVTRLRLQAILLKIAKITSFLHEDVGFGQHLICATIEDCFSNSPGLVGVTESSFLNWMENSPVFVSWILTMFKLKNSEMVVHSSKCSVCRNTPIVGLRYKCVKCLRYNLCQNCFLRGRVSGSHKVTHSVKEFCTDESSKDVPHAIVKKICGLIRCSGQNNMSTCTSKQLNTGLMSGRKSPISEIEDTIMPLSSPLMQLQVVIRQLELQNSELQTILKSGKKTDNEIKRYLEEHRQHVATQIQKLKTLMEYLQKSYLSPAETALPKVHESTPMIANGMGRAQSRLELDIFSPIRLCQIKESQDRNTDRETTEHFNDSESLRSYSLKDVSTWIAKKEDEMSASNQQNRQMEQRKTPVRLMHNHLDDALAKLQQILANNFTLDESLGTIDNGQLKTAVNEVEGMLNSFIDSVETSRANSAQKKYDSSS